MPGKRQGKRTFQRSLPFPYPLSSPVGKLAHLGWLEKACLSPVPQPSASVATRRPLSGLLAGQRGAAERRAAREKAAAENEARFNAWREAVGGRNAGGGMAEAEGRGEGRTRASAGSVGSATQAGAGDGRGGRLGVVYHSLYLYDLFERWRRRFERPKVRGAADSCIRPRPSGDVLRRSAASGADGVMLVRQSRTVVKVGVKSVHGPAPRLVDGGARPALASPPCPISPIGHARHATMPTRGRCG